MDKISSDFEILSVDDDQLPSSKVETLYEKNCIFVERNPEIGLRILISVNQDQQIYVSSIMPESELHDYLMEEDVIYSVNDEDLYGMSLEEAALLIKTLSGSIKIVYARKRRQKLEREGFLLHKPRRSMKPNFDFKFPAPNLSLKKKPEILTTQVRVVKQKDGKLGFTIVSGKRMKSDRFNSVFIKEISSDIVYAGNNKLKKWDRLVRINGVIIDGKSKKEIVAFLGRTEENVIVLDVRKI